MDIVILIISILVIGGIICYLSYRLYDNQEKLKKATLIIQGRETMPIIPSSPMTATTKEQAVKEYYCSPDTAKLLKDKGFDIPVRTYYKGDSDEINYGDNLNWNSSSPELVSAPTIQLVLDWLEKKHNYFITCVPYKSYTGYYSFSADIYKISKKYSQYHGYNIDTLENVDQCFDRTRREVLDRAIRFLFNTLVK